MDILYQSSFNNQQAIQISFIFIENFDSNALNPTLNLLHFKAEYGQSATFVQDNKAYHVYGLGKQKDFTTEKARKIGHKIFNNCSQFQFIELEMQNLQYAIEILIGLYLYAHHYDKYKSIKPVINIDTAQISINNQEVVTQFQQMQTILNATLYCRDLSNMPANMCHPVFLEQEAIRIHVEGENCSLKVKVLNEMELKTLNMNALLGVGQGSTMPARLILLEYTHHDAHNQPIALVGKGITFDTGGISIKPSHNMHHMKHDMSGSAVVLSSLKAVYEMGLPINVVGVMAVAENMCSSHAQRPGDIVMSASGKTIEVLDTDAEGRLVLADALWYTQTYYEPSMIIDYATLTGAVSVALGSVYGAIFSNNDVLCEQLIESSNHTLENLWKLPLHEKFTNAMKSQVADLQNIANRGFGGGSSTAAAFLQEFIDDKYPWCHLDIAGVSEVSAEAFSTKFGATGFGVRLTLDFIFKQLSKKRSDG